MSIGKVPFGDPKLLSASGQVAGGTAMSTTPLQGAENTTLPGTIMGFYVNSTSSGTIVLSAGSASGGTALTGTITPAVGWHTLPITSPTGIYATLANTISVTFVVVD